MTEEEIVKMLTPLSFNDVVELVKDLKANNKHLLSHNITLDNKIQEIRGIING